MGSDRYRLVLFEAPEDPTEARALIARTLAAHPTDVAQWLARAPGPWPHPLEAGPAKALLDGLYELGIPAEAWRVEAYPILVPPRTVRSLKSSADGLLIQGLRHEPTHWLTWDHIELVSLGYVESDPAADAPGRWSRRVGWIRRAFENVAPLDRRRTPREPTGELHLVRREPRLCLRFEQDHLNYSGLASAKGSSARQNFLAFVREVVARADSAYLTHPTRDAIKGDEFEMTVFPDSNALLEYTTHRLLWSWYRRDRERNDEGREIRATEGT